MTDAAGEEPIDRRLEAAILDLLDRRAASSSICPSDAARAVAAEGDWRPLMEAARQAAQRLVESGEVDITQGGDIVDLANVRGPIRIRRRRT